MFGFFKLQPFVPASMSRPVSRKSYDALASLPSLPSEAPSARVECTVSRYEFGRVCFEGVSWRAKCMTDRCYEPGDRVKVLYRQDNALWVDTLLEQ
jgi:membrane-bound ClpP family serine protease